MTYGRMLNPRFYMDNPNALASRGSLRSSLFGSNTGAGFDTFNTGYNVYQLFDSDPLNLCSFDTSNSADMVSIKIDLGLAGISTNYLSIMNHNLYSANGVVRVAHSTSAITTAGGGTTVLVPSFGLNGTSGPDSTATVNEIMDTSETGMDVSDGTLFTIGEIVRVTGSNGNENMLVTNIVSNTLTVTRAQQGSTAKAFEVGDAIYRYNAVLPAADGDTLFTFTASTDRYWIVEFYSPKATWSATDFTIGQIVLGQHTTIALSPDMSITRGSDYDGVSVRRSYSGKSFGTASHVMPNTGGYTPFRGSTDAIKSGGRESFDFLYSYLADTVLYPSDRSAPTAAANFMADVADKCSMGLIPFIFTPDSTSTTAGDYLWARFGQPGITTTRQAWTVETFSARIVQEF